MIHGGDGKPALLPLGQVKGGHHRCLLVLGWVFLDDGLKALLVVFGEFPLGGRGVVRGVTVLPNKREGKDIRRELDRLREK